jgi:hypothetical protein
MATNNAINNSFPSGFTSSGLAVSSVGIATNTNQPAFYAYLSSSAGSVTGDGTFYRVICDTVLTNQGSYYNNSTGLFTAPVTGLYSFTATIAFSGLTSQTNATVVFEVGSQTVYTTILNPSVNSGGVLAFNCGIGPYPVTATTTVAFEVQVSGGAKTVNVFGDPAVDGLFTQFGGYLVC